MLAGRRGAAPSWLPRLSIIPGGGASGHGHPRGSSSRRDGGDAVGGRGRARCHGGGSGGGAQLAPARRPRYGDGRRPRGLGGGEQRPALPGRAGGAGECGAGGEGGLGQGWPGRRGPRSAPGSPRPPRLGGPSRACLFLSPACGAFVGCKGEGRRRREKKPAANEGAASLLGAV